MEATFSPPWSSSDAERWCFGGVNMCTLTGLYAAPYATNCDAMCILISSDPALTFFCNQSYSNLFVGSTWICLGSPSMSLAPVTLLLVHHSSFLGPLLKNTDHYRLGTPHKTTAFVGSLLAQQLWGQNVHLLPNISPPTNRRHDEEIISVIPFIRQWS